MAIDLDVLDRKILRIVQKNARLTAEAIGEEAGLSAAAAHRRLRRLREEGVIEGEVAVLNAKALGAPMTFILTVVMEREHADIMEAFANRMRAHDQVQQCYEITGEADFVIVIKARDMDDFQSFCEDAFFDRHNFRKFNTSVVMDHIKTGQHVPVGEGG